ncbi:MAG: siroheme synthase [Nitratireductor sp.]|nr:siroheme synthase [Nitratireductor sp.]
MRFFPLFVDLQGQTVVVSGAGEHAAAKIRLLLKTPADILVFGTSPCEAVRRWHEEGRLQLAKRQLQWDDVAGARLVYGANGDAALDAAAVELGRWAGALTNIVDDLDNCDFLTPAIVDRDPVTVAVGTEGTAPVLARKIKADVEEMLPADTGRLARIAQTFRPAVAGLKQATARRALWTRFFFNDGPAAFAAGGAVAAIGRLHELLAGISSEAKLPGRVTFVSVTQSDPELLTLKARKALQHAGTVFHDRSVSRAILEIARREATFEERGQGSVTRMVQAAANGQDIVCIASVPAADVRTFQREIAAFEAAGLAWEILPGVMSAVIASAGEDQPAAAAQKPEGRNIIPLPAAATGRTASQNHSRTHLRTGAL